MLGSIGNWSLINWDIPRREPERVYTVAGLDKNLFGSPITTRTVVCNFRALADNVKES